MNRILSAVLAFGLLATGCQEKTVAEKAKDDPTLATCLQFSDAVAARDSDALGRAMDRFDRMADNAENHPDEPTQEWFDNHPIPDPEIYPYLLLFRVDRAEGASDEKLKFDLDNIHEACLKYIGKHGG